MTIYKMSATELLAGYRARSLSPVEAMKSVLDHVGRRNPQINALVFLDEDLALAEASESERRWLRGEPKGVLDGVPITIKDSIGVAGRPMLRGIAANWGSAPLKADAPPAARVREAGAIIFAKTTMPDFGLAGTGVSSAFGITRNPWNLAFNTGGSSSGAAAATAVGFGPLALGTDVGGSVRWPASLCGLVGMKPSQGRVPHLPPSPIRSAGPIARTVLDAALLLTVVSRPDRRDHHCLPPENVDYRTDLCQELSGVRIGLVQPGDSDVPAEPAIQEAFEKSARSFADAGASLEPVGPLWSKEFFQAVSRVLLIKGAAEMEQLGAAGKAGLHPYFSRWFGQAPSFSATDLAKAYDFIEYTKARALAAIAPFDFVMAPTSYITGFPAEALSPVGDMTDPDHMADQMAFTTVLWNFTGNPAVSICNGFDPRGLPIGLQIVGQRFDDAGVLRMAATFERLRGFALPWPA
jgi:Asp-tRNA(Asn)/Glu-tRNA(Gln) amidotransferase A subunit family amidase